LFKLKNVEKWKRTHKFYAYIFLQQRLFNIEKSVKLPLNLS
jgi:hypothetical protein